MALTVGQQLGSYEITALLGKGGMGEVYRARDLKLKREVAIKILPEEFSSDADRVTRFQREAEVLASLIHPNIAGIYDVQEALGTRFLILELVEGETLADRIARGPIPMDEALAIAVQICEALEAAHEKGIIHRDLKPANVKLTPDGKVKVLDFGLAKVMEGTAANPDLSSSPTLVTGSMAGMIFGTPAYMSPEQARAQRVDARTDIWAFGCIIYELLSARSAFESATATDTLTKIIAGQPDWNALPEETPASIRTLLAATLTKERHRRLQHVGDARLFLNTQNVQEPAIAPAPVVRSGRLVMAVLAIGMLAALIPATLYFRREPEEKVPIRFEMAAPGILDQSLSISPDGQQIAYTALTENFRQPAIWIRRLGDVKAQVIPGTEGAGAAIFWSPDNRSIAFYADARL